MDESFQAEGKVHTKALWWERTFKDLERVNEAAMQSKGENEEWQAVGLGRWAAA